MLGNIVSENKVKPDPKNMEAIRNYKIPENINELRSCLGLANQVRHYVTNFAIVCNQLTSLLKGKTN